MDNLEIIKTMLNEDEVNAVNARDLHAALKSGQQYSNWIQNRIGQCGFVQDVDFVQLNKIGASASKPLKEYYLTLDAAKHIAMLERNIHGKAVRTYFIEFEKKAKQILPQMTTEQIMAHAILHADQVMKQQAAKLEEQAPKVEETSR
jgi:anti-repressor protein